LGDVVEPAADIARLRARRFSGSIDSGGTCRQSTPVLQRIVGLSGGDRSTDRRRFRLRGCAGNGRLVTADLVVDVEEGVHLQGSLGGFSHYTGVGLGLMF
jgi:hypothetical protein